MSPPLLLYNIQQRSNVAMFVAKWSATLLVNQVYPNICLKQLLLTQSELAMNSARAGPYNIIIGLSTGPGSPSSVQLTLKIRWSSQSMKMGFDEQNSTAHPSLAMASRGDWNTGARPKQSQIDRGTNTSGSYPF